MDRFIARLPAEEDGDLMLCRDEGIAYQKDMTDLVAYDAAYFQKCQSYEDQKIANEINAGRIALVNRRIGLQPCVDIGIGSGEFIKRRGNTFGFDVNPVAIDWLKKNDLWAEHLDEFGGYTMWDVLEHCTDPEIHFCQIKLHAFLFVSIPIFTDLGSIRKSRHYRPSEHLYYFEEQGFVDWMAMHGFLLVEEDTFEIDAGRDSIFSFAFKRIRWPKQ